MIIYNISAQAVKVNQDGDDALDIDNFQVSSYLECIKTCLGNSQCRFIIKTGRTCYLKASTPANLPCSPNSECAVVLSIHWHLI
jgi:hypothetical protein